MKNEIKQKRPYIFYNKNHWDSECQVYSIVNTRLKRLKEKKECTICLKVHQGEEYKRKVKYFYCKASDSSALCEKRNRPHPNTILCLNKS